MAVIHASKWMNKSSCNTRAYWWLQYGLPLSALAVFIPYRLVARETVALSIRTAVRRLEAKSEP